MTLITSNYERYKKSFDFSGIFTPTLTSELIIKFSENYLLKNQRILDLGCGGGIISGSLYQKKLNQSFYLSDLDSLAVKKAKKNLGHIKGNFIIKQGNLFEPWENQKFDLIINDVSGVSSRVAKISPWFKNIPINNSISGTNFLERVVNKCRYYMNSNSTIITPIISLSDVKKAKNFLKKKLKIISIKEFDWPLPQAMVSNIKVLEKLKKDKIIYFKKKFGIIICSTILIAAKKK